MLSCPNAEVGTGTALISQLTEHIILFERIITVLQLVTTQKTFKTVEKSALLMILCNDASSDELFQIFQMIVIS
jgi:hypothetical protein